MDFELSSATKKLEEANRREKERKLRQREIEKKIAKEEEERNRLAQERKRIEQERAQQEARVEEEKRIKLLQLNGGITYTRNFPVVLKESPSADAEDAAFYEEGLSDRAIIPSVILEDLMGMNARFPLQFAIFPTNEDYFSTSRKAFISVQDFCQEEIIYLPREIMKRLNFLSPDGVPEVSDMSVTIQYVQLPKAQEVTLRPKQMGFTDCVPNVLVFLGKWLQSKYAILSSGTILPVIVRNPGSPPMTFELLVNDVVPQADAVSTVDVDLKIKIIESIPNPNMHPRNNRSVNHPFPGQPPTDKRQEWLIDDITLEDQKSAKLSFEESHYYKLNIQNLPDCPRFSICATVSPKSGAQDNSPDVDLYLSFPPLKYPNRTNHDIASADSIGSKEVILRKEDFVSHHHLYVSVIGSSDSAEYSLKIVIPNDHGHVNEGATQELGDRITCSNCGGLVPRANYQMHEAFCRRNVRVCNFPGCAARIKANEMGSHIHCTDCGAVYGENAKEKHQRLYHQNQRCGCGVLLPYREMRNHIKSTCPLRIIVCKYCQEEQEAGEGVLSVEDKYYGISSPHESRCGSVTSPCPICKKLIQRKRLEFHIQAHRSQPTSETAERSIPQGNTSNPRQREDFIGRFQCPICLAPFASEREVGTHVDDAH
eukprot:TRINITY_DN10641_c0_g1_i2.p1 TRINITY_DN10641_c0_g1~~TRINITY_DN10641_c0_g1_i2.p1  ORF type:complete len:653 (+),score=110.43 TRINITY_DN10641_c0_g1_i2:40-1998(+)